MDQELLLKEHVEDVDFLHNLLQVQQHMLMRQPDDLDMDDEEYNEMLILINTCSQSLVNTICLQSQALNAKIAS